MWLAFEAGRGAKTPATWTLREHEEEIYVPDERCVRLNPVTMMRFRPCWRHGSPLSNHISTEMTIHRRPGKILAQLSNHPAYFATLRWTLGASSRHIIAPMRTSREWFLFVPSKPRADHAACVLRPNPWRNVGARQQRVQRVTQHAVRPISNLVPAIGFTGQEWCSTGSLMEVRFYLP